MRSNGHSKSLPLKELQHSCVEEMFRILGRWGRPCKHVGNEEITSAATFADGKLTQQEVNRRDHEKPNEGFLAHWASPERYIKAAAWLLTTDVIQG